MAGQRDNKGSEAMEGWKASKITKGQRLWRDGRPARSQRVKGHRRMAGQRDNNGQRPRREGVTARSQRVKGHGRMEGQRDHKGSEAMEGWKASVITKGQRLWRDGRPA